MTDPIIRPAVIADVPGMAALWQERMTLRQQVDSRFRVAPDGRAAWSQAATAWLTNPRYALYVAEDDQALVGYLVACVEDAPPGLIPAQVGVVTEMAVGAHSYRSGLGRHLLQPVRQWFAEQGIPYFMAYVPRRVPVEQAFWRAAGGTELTDILWMKV